MKKKSHSGAKKRVIIKKKKIFLRKAGKSHLLINKSKRQKRSFNTGLPLHPSYEKKIKRLLYV